MECKRFDIFWIIVTVHTIVCDNFGVINYYLDYFEMPTLNYKVNSDNSVSYRNNHDTEIVYWLHYNAVTCIKTIEIISFFFRSGSSQFLEK